MDSDASASKKHFAKALSGRDCLERYEVEIGKEPDEWSSPSTVSMAQLKRRNSNRFREKLSKSDQMARVRTVGTALERKVRLALSSRGVRYRLNDARFPGKPDLYIGRIRVAVFVHGCFWHGHSCKRGGLPKTNEFFWKQKIIRNRQRDEMNRRALQALNITVIEVWACEAEFLERTADHIGTLYRSSRKSQ
jgi:DNA mismatch endonuclease, patch repair protein